MGAEPHYEFGGPLGAFGVMAGLPCVLYALTALCGASGCPDMARWPPVWPADAQPVFTPVAMGVYLAWFFGVAVLHLVLPGLRREGTVLRTGKRLAYKLNGMLVRALAPFAPLAHAEEGHGTNEGEGKGGAVQSAIRSEHVARLTRSRELAPAPRLRQSGTLRRARRRDRCSRSVRVSHSDPRRCYSCPSADCSLRTTRVRSISFGWRTTPSRC